MFHGGRPTVKSIHFHKHNCVVIEVVSQAVFFVIVQPNAVSRAPNSGIRDSLGQALFKQNFISMCK